MLLSCWEHFLQHCVIKGETELGLQTLEKLQKVLLASQDILALLLKYITKAVMEKE